MDKNQRFDTLEEFARMLEANELMTGSDELIVGQTTPSKFIVVSQEEYDWYTARIKLPAPAVPLFHGYKLKVNATESE